MFANWIRYAIPEKIKRKYCIWSEGDGIEVHTGNYQINTIILHMCVLKFVNACHLLIRLMENPYMIWKKR